MKFLNRRIAKWASKVIRNELAKSTELVDELGQPKINPVWMCTRNKQITRPYYYLGKNWALTQLSNGLPFFVNTDDHGIATWIILGGTWENFVDDVLCAYAQPGMTVLDIGANLGYYTIKLADRIGPQGHLHAFEPNPELAPFVRENININGFRGRCSFYEIAASDVTGANTLVFEYSNMGGGGFAAPAPGKKSAEVQLRRLDDILDGVAMVDLVKIDAEGHEPYVLRGAKRLIERSAHCAYMLEIALDTWLPHGPIEDRIAPLAEGKILFAVPHSGGPVRIERSTVNAYLEQQSGVSYVFLCPEQEASRIMGPPAVAERLPAASS
jgi:FkbM family methyltransferase